jgi:hypothetical protein
LEAWTYLKGRGIETIDLLAITNYDRDHVSGLNNLLDNINVRTLLRNKLVIPDNLRAIKKQTGGISPSIERLIHEIENVSLLPLIRWFPLVSPIKYSDTPIRRLPTPTI